MEIHKTFRFESAHRLPNVASGHKCGRLHGHSYEIEVHVRGSVGAESGWVMDFADIAVAFAPLEDALVHRYLNEVPGLENPTCENLARWIWKRMRPSLPLLSKVVIHETCTSGCSYSGEDG
jgi:6-pyruvoyltetrahydropterin/6-carboxytetrahydropterin synthase